MNNQYGRVKWFNETKGFGFITSDHGGEDLFAHYSQIEIPGFKKLDKNQLVQFDILKGEKGAQAINIRPM